MSRMVDGVEVDPKLLTRCGVVSCDRYVSARSGRMFCCEFCSFVNPPEHTAACHRAAAIRITEFSRALERSSLGTPAARALRERTPQHVADTITSRAEELRARDAHERMFGGPTICYACGLAIVDTWDAWRERDGRVRHGDC